MSTDTDPDRYIAVIDQDAVTDEVRDIAIKYDPLNRSGETGFHVTADGELHIDDVDVMAEHKLIEKKIPNDAIRIVPLPTASGTVVHQYGANGFRLFDLPAPEPGAVVGVFGPNGIGKTTVLRILSGRLVPNLGAYEQDSTWEAARTQFRGTALQRHFKRLENDAITAIYKPQRVDDTDNIGEETVGELLQKQDRDPETLIDAFELRDQYDRRITALSGGERQRVYLAATLLTDANLYLLDEPSSFLDVSQRFAISKTIREHINQTEAACLVVEHDLATLDLLADHLHVAYGDPGNFGNVSQRLATGDGINQFLDGYLAGDNVQIRAGRIEFPAPQARDPAPEDAAYTYPQLRKSFEQFQLTVASGTVHSGEVLGILGENGLGKTTFAQLLTGQLTPDSGPLETTRRVAYKPQSLDGTGQGTVREQFRAATNIHDQQFQTHIYDPFDLEPLFDRQVSALSGGELQRVGIALCLSRDAEMYLLDEPSAYLDVERRVDMATQIRRFTRRIERPVLVIDHDLFVMDRIADRLLVFTGTPGVAGKATQPQSMREGMNHFLSTVGITFRRDARTNRPRVNDPGSQLDRTQRRTGEYYYPE